MLRQVALPSIALAIACGGPSHRITLVPEKSPDPAAVVVGHESEAGIAVFFGLFDAAGAKVDLDSVEPGNYTLKVAPPCGRSTEKAVEIRSSRAVKVAVPAIAPQTRYVRQTLEAPELRYGKTKKTLTIAGDSEVKMFRPWPLKPAGDGFAAGSECIGALIQVVEPASPEGEFYIVPRSALRESPTEPIPGGDLQPNPDEDESTDDDGESEGDGI